jgi:molecular chaperone Hsp33
MADQLVRALFHEGRGRVVCAVTTELVREAARRHEALGLHAVMLGRGATAALLVSTHATKDDARVTVQLHGEGPVSTLAADAVSAGGVRVYASLNDPAAVIGATLVPGQRPSLTGLVGVRGTVQVSRDLGLRQRYSGSSRTISGEVDTDVEGYLLGSEQVDSALGCEVVPGAGGEVVVAAGVLAMALPGGDVGDTLARARERLRGDALWHALAAGERDPLALARAVLGEGTSLEVVDEREPRFFCPCSRERVTAMLRMLGERDLAAMIAEGQAAEIVCNFCRERYEVSMDELEKLGAERAPKGQA